MGRTLWSLAAPVAASMGFDLLDLEWIPGKHQGILRLYIDTTNNPPRSGGLPPRATAGLEDCARVSRAVAAMMDEKDPIAQAYTLEVSSPGIDRPLRLVSHFRAAVGGRISLRTRTPDDAGRRNFRGRLVAVVDSPTATEDPSAQGSSAMSLPIRSPSIPAAWMGTGPGPVLTVDLTESAKPDRGQGGGKRGSTAARLTADPTPISDSPTTVRIPYAAVDRARWIFDGDLFAGVGDADVVALNESGEVVEDFADDGTFANDNALDNVDKVSTRGSQSPNRTKPPKPRAEKFSSKRRGSSASSVGTPTSTSARSPTFSPQTPRFPAR